MNVANISCTKKPLVMIPILVLAFPFLYMYVQGQSSLTYENPTYGIEMQYPSSWNKDLNVSAPDVVTFFPSAVDSSASLTVTIDDISDEKGIPLAQYASDSSDAIKHETKDFRLLESTTNNTLAGLPAYKSIYSYAARNNSTVQGMEIGAIKGGKVYIFTYEAGPNEYDEYLPIAQQIIYSFQFQIAPPSSQPQPTQQQQIPPSQGYQTIQIFNGNIGLQPLQWKLYTFTIPNNAIDIYLKGSISVSGGAIETITFNLYDASQCPPPDSEGNIDWSACTGVASKDYYSGGIDQYISHGGTFYLALYDSSSFFNKVVNGNIYVEYQPGG